MTSSGRSPPGCRPTSRTSCVRALRRRPADGGRARRQADPRRRRPGRRLGRRRRRAALGGRRRPRRRGAAGRRRAVLRGRAGGRASAASARWSNRCPMLRWTVTLVVPPLRVEHAGGVRRVGPSRRPDRRRVPTTSSRRRSTSSRGWRGGATGSASSPALPPVLAGSGATWFVEGRHDDALAPLRVVEGRRCTSLELSDRAGPPPVAGLLAALVARAAQHLLVLLLPHALAALLDQRTHTGGNATGVTGGLRATVPFDGSPGSFNR